MSWEAALEDIGGRIRGAILEQQRPVGHSLSSRFGLAQAVLALSSACAALPPPEPPQRAWPTVRGVHLAPAIHPVGVDELACLASSE